MHHDRCDLTQTSVFFHTGYHVYRVTEKCIHRCMHTLFSFFHKGWLILLSTQYMPDLFPHGKVRKPHLTFWVCFYISHPFAHVLDCITAAIHILFIWRYSRQLHAKGKSMLRETMAYLRWLPPCLITRWFVTLSGKDTSCYCPNPTF